MDTQYDDDRFYAELRKQVLLLTSEDNEENVVRKSTGVFIPQAITYRGNENSRLSPYWFVKLWKNLNENGTGVFIPQAVTTCTTNLRPENIYSSGGELKNMQC